MLSDGFAYWVSIGSSAACSNNTINFAPFGRRTQAKARAGYHGALLHLEVPAPGAPQVADLVPGRSESLP